MSFAELCRFRFPILAKIPFSIQSLPFVSGNLLPLSGIHRCVIKRGLHLSKSELKKETRVHRHSDSAFPVVASAKPTEEAEAPKAAYLHIPFCRRRCYYCDFPIQVVGDKASENLAVLDGMSSYVDLVCREMASSAAHWGPSGPLSTIYFGGGTPSLIPPSLLERLLSSLDRCFGIAADAEVSMEMDPGTFDQPKLQSFLGLGVNRVSLGVQAFQPNLLQTCGRAHGIDEVFQAIDDVHAAGVSDWSLDLISGLPGQTPDDWNNSLQAAIKAGPTHMSVYDLQIEEGTPFARRYRPGQHPLPDDAESADSYAAASAALRAAGFEHYEVSNYARPGLRCRHNQVYWRCLPFHAFGLGAASYVDRRRIHRPRKMAEYANWVDNFHACQGHISGVPRDSPEDRFSDRLMLSLRTADGLDLEDLAAEFGSTAVNSLCQALAPYIESRHVIAVDPQVDVEKLIPQGSKDLVGASKLSIAGGASVGTSRGAWSKMQIRLSDPQGFLLSNEIISALFHCFPEK